MLFLKRGNYYDLFDYKIEQQRYV